MKAMSEESLFLKFCLPLVQIHGTITSFFKIKKIIKSLSHSIDMITISPYISEAPERD